MNRHARTFVRIAIIAACVAAVVVVTTTPATWAGWFRRWFGWPTHYTPTISSGAEG